MQGSGPPSGNYYLDGARTLWVFQGPTERVWILLSVEGIYLIKESPFTAHTITIESCDRPTNDRSLLCSFLVQVVRISHDGSRYLEDEKFRATRNGRKI